MQPLLIQNICCPEYHDRCLRTQICSSNNEAEIAFKVFYPEEARGLRAIMLVVLPVLAVKLEEEDAIELAANGNCAAL